MPIFTVPVNWQMAGEYSVEAETLEEAIEKVFDAEPPYECLPKGGEYVDDSMTVNHDCLKELN
jgi:hypothetical protein